MPSSKKIFYPDEFKELSTKLALDSDQPISKTVESLGVKDTTLYGWVKKYYPTHHNVKKLQLSESDAEIRGLKKELAQVKQERDILKKAAGYFAKETL